VLGWAQVSYALRQAAFKALSMAEEPKSARGKATPRKRPRREGSAPADAGAADADASTSGSG
jgi:hypothetical protein